MIFPPVISFYIAFLIVIKFNLPGFSHRFRDCDSGRQSYDYIKETYQFLTTLIKEFFQYSYCLQIWIHKQHFNKCTQLYFAKHPMAHYLFDTFAITLLIDIHL